MFFAYRHGHLTPADQSGAAWSALEQRLNQIERLLRGQAMVESPEFARAVTFAPPVFRLTRADGRLRNQKRPKFWHDIEVREALIRLHRQTTVLRARATVIAELGEDRAPSTSAIHRFWKDLDQTRSSGASAMAASTPSRWPTNSRKPGSTTCFADAPAGGSPMRLNSCCKSNPPSPENRIVAAAPPEITSESR